LFILLIKNINYQLLNKLSNILSILNHYRTNIPEIMKKKEFKLVTGTFNVDEAQEVLMSLIIGKINFHTKRILSLRERNGIEDEHSEKRIEELNASREQILHLLKQADDSKHKITIDSTIYIEIQN